MAMRDILLDTNAYAAFKRGVPEVIEVIRHAPFIGISSIVLGELLAGFAVGSREAANVEELRRFMGSPRVRLLPVDDVTASHYAGVYKDLRHLGQPIPTNDMWIACDSSAASIGSHELQWALQGCEGNCCRYLSDGL